MCDTTKTKSRVHNQASGLLHHPEFISADQQQPEDSKAVLSSSCLELPEPTGYLAAAGICLPPPEFASLYQGRTPALRGTGVREQKSGGST
ncbi:hypothetical protein EYF80_055451 [Liparis tanakae]|uniref:Uncharacterized protein n=1 Tax=Liparis tanakae TaxID=230148 RepID=A0A4Z2EZI9_9TELE|nr:hypothetical protein EYF80_055451 [Liparis tanakae]